jgi:hypothetical protein
VALLFGFYRLGRELRQRGNEGDKGPDWILGSSVEDDARLDPTATLPVTASGKKMYM